MRTRVLTAALTLAAAGLLAAPAVAQASPASATTTAAVTTAGMTKAQVDQVLATTHGRLHPHTQHTLNIDYQVQNTSYWCGPAATRIALSARISPPSQDTLAAQLGTTVNGTDDISQVTTVLNADLGSSWYETKYMPNDPPTQAQKDLLWNDIVLDINNNYPIVANIVAPPGNQPPGYPGDETIYHYFTVIGYDDSNSTVEIGDPADFSGYQIYWLSFDQLSTLIPPKGYSA